MSKVERDGSGHTRGFRRVNIAKVLDNILH